MIKENTFSKIILDDLEHIVFMSNAQDVWQGKFNQNDNNKHIVVYDNIKDLHKHQFTKKYNLIYSGDNFSQGCDPIFNRKERTDVLVAILKQNQDKHFLIIDHDRVNAYTISQFKNCEVWCRKYYTDFYEQSRQKLDHTQPIEKDRKHWFCALMGRADLIRSKMFHWIMDNKLDKDNKVSYLATGMKYPRKYLEDDVQSNYMSNGGIEKYKQIIPFNNFEDKIPNHIDDRLKYTKPVFDCLFNITLEGLMTNDSTDISEKSLDTIIHGHIPVIISGAGTMKKLQDMGIIIPDYIKWSIWDDLSCNQINFSRESVIQRQILDLSKRYKINEIAHDWYPYALRNLQKFKDLKTNCLEEEKEICRWILLATHNISNLKYQNFY